MISIQIDDIKSFMKLLLIDGKFDSFQLIQGYITTYNTFEIDGRINPEFFGTEYDTSELYGYTYTPMSKARELIYQLIKGKHTPIAFKLTIKADNELQNKVLMSVPDSAPSKTHISNLILNIKYDSNGLYIISGTSTDTFVMDKSVEEAWDEWIKTFMQDMQ